MTTPTTLKQSVDELAKDSALSMWKSYCAKKEQCEDLAEQIEALTKERDGLQQAVIDRDSITRGLLERIESLKPDVDRYQWLRDPAQSEAIDMIEQYDGSDLDAAIDAAMKAAA